MIRVTRLNNQPLVINSDLIKLLETAPDTLLTLVNGEKIVVKESADEVIERIVAFRREVLAGIHGITERTAAGAGYIPAPNEPVKGN